MILSDHVSSSTRPATKILLLRKGESKGREVGRLGWKDEMVGYERVVFQKV